MMIDYKMAGKAIRNLPLAGQRWVAKSAARFLPYRVNMKQWKLWEVDQCPRCHQQEESKEHITQCQNPETVEVWTKSLQMLDDWLQKSNTDPQLQKDLITGLMKWNQAADQGTMESKSFAAQKQDALGWDLLLVASESSIQQV